MIDAPPTGVGPLRVLVTRALVDAPGLVRALVEAGHAPVVVPLLEIAYRIDALAEAARAHPAADWVLVTSAVGADALAIAAPGAWRSARFAAVGPATAQRLRDHGYAVAVTPDRYTALDLVAAVGDVDGVTIVLPRGDLAPPEPVDTLRKGGAVVIDVVCYANVAPPGHERALLAALPVDATTLFSGSAAERLARAIPPERRHELGRVIVVGPATAETAVRLGLPVDTVAQPHSVAGVLAALAAPSTRVVPEG